MALGGPRRKDGQWPFESDKAAIERAYARHSRGLAGRIWSILGPVGIDGPDGLHDVLQNTFLIFAEELKRGTTIQNVGAWLYKVATNETLKIKRRKASHGDVSLKSLVEGLNTKEVKGLWTEQEPPLTILEREEQEKSLLQAIKRLPPQLLDVVILRYFGERKQSYQEIAETLGLTEDQVNHRLRDAVKMLRKALMDGSDMEAAS